jgi:hypothetical protein
VVVLAAANTGASAILRFAQCCDPCHRKFVALTAISARALVQTLNARDDLKIADRQRRGASMLQEELGRPVIMLIKRERFDETRIS